MTPTRSVRVGKRYQVCEGSGLDSGRVGRVTSMAGLSWAFFKRIEPGRYWDFNPAKEALLIDDDNKYFTMFKTRLDAVDG